MALSEQTRKFLADPPPGSKTREALDFGVDISLTAQRLEMTVAQRLADLGARMDWIKALRRARHVD